MAFALFARVTPRFSTPVVTIEDDYDFAHISDSSSDFGVQSVATTEISIDNSSHPVLLDTYIKHATRPLDVVDSWLLTTIPWDELRGRTPDELIELERELPNCSIDSAAANDLALAGRGDAGHVFQDIRSAAKSRRRCRTELEKYWNFRVVKRGAIGEPHEIHTMLPGARPEPQIAPMTKKMRYEMAQDYPRPPKYSRRLRDKDRWPWQQSFIDRQKVKKHGFGNLERLEMAPEPIGEWDIDRMREQIEDEWEDWTYTCLTCYDSVDESDEHARLRIVPAGPCSCGNSNRPVLSDCHCPRCRCLYNW